MDSDANIRSSRTLANWFLTVALLGLLVAAGLSVYAVCVPLNPSSPGHISASRRWAMPTRTDASDADALVARIAGNPLIRPAQVTAAVKDSGAAQRLLKKLRLHGVTQVGSQRTAYIEVGGKSVAKVRRGDEVLGLVVERVDASEVVLSLEGVLVTLRN